MQVAYINPRTPAPIAKKHSNTSDSSTVEGAIILFCYDRCVRTASKLLMQEHLYLANSFAEAVLVRPMRAGMHRVAGWSI